MTLSATDAGNFTGTISGTFTIAGKDVSTLDIALTGADDLKYDGTAKTPAVTVKMEPRLSSWELITRLLMRIM